MDVIKDFINLKKYNAISRELNSVKKELSDVKRYELAKDEKIKSLTEENIKLHSLLNVLLQAYSKHINKQ